MKNLYEDKIKINITRYRRTPEVNVVYNTEYRRDSIASQIIMKLSNATYNAPVVESRVVTSCGDSKSQK